MWIFIRIKMYHQTYRYDTLVELKSENLESEQNTYNSIGSHKLSVDLYATLNNLFLWTSMVNA